MNALPVVIILELVELSPKIAGVPEWHEIEELHSYCPNESLDEGVRERQVGHRLDFRDLENPHIRSPSVKLIERIVIAAEIAGQRAYPGDRLIEQTADRRAVEYADMNDESDNPAAVLIHDDHRPMGSKDQRLAAEEIHTPQPVLRMAEEGEPGRATDVRLRVVVLSQHASYEVLVDLDTEYKGDLLSDYARIGKP